MANWLPLNFRFDHGDWLDLSKVQILQYSQKLKIRYRSHLLEVEVTSDIPRVSTIRCTEQPIKTVFTTEFTNWRRVPAVSFHSRTRKGMKHDSRA